MSADPFALRVHVPVACFRVPYARDYAETYPVPPPATVYGMLLSMAGEEEREAHVGARIAIGRLTESPTSRVLRTYFRWKDKDITSAKNRAPDYQELLTDVRLVVWLAPGEGEPFGQPLAERVACALADPASTQRFGALCLGESTHLVDGIWPLVDRPIQPPDEQLEVLTPDPGGDLTLPLWADHIGSAGTRWGRFTLTPHPTADWRPAATGWTTISPPT